MNFHIGTQLPSSPQDKASTCNATSIDQRDLRLRAVNQAATQVDQSIHHGVPTYILTSYRVAYLLLPDES